MNAIESKINVVAIQELIMMPELFVIEVGPKAHVLQQDILVHQAIKKVAQEVL